MFGIISVLIDSSANLVPIYFSFVVVIQDRTGYCFITIIYIIYLYSIIEIVEKVPNNIILQYLAPIYLHIAYNIYNLK